MNSMNDSGEFQEVESNHSGRMSYVPSQLAAIPSSCSMLRRDKRLPLDTWNTSGSQEIVFGNQFSAFDSSRNHCQGIHPSTTPGASGSVPQANWDRDLFRKSELRAQFQCRHLQEGRRPQVHFFWMFHRIHWLESKDSKYRNCNSTSSQHFLHSLVGR